MKKQILKAVVITKLAIMLMCVSGYVGARVALMNIDAPLANYESHDEVHIPLKVSTNIGIELMNNISSANEFSLPELFDRANPSVVAISTEIVGRNVFGMQVTRPSSGSGFLISGDGYIVTNDHVIENANSITILMHDGREFPATVVGRDPNSDLAVIKIDGTGFPFLIFGNSEHLRVGHQVAAIGNPLGQLANSMTVGYVSALNRDVNIDGISRNKIQTDTAVNRGNSGGPLLNLYGEVIGVVSAKSSGMDVEGLGFAIPSNHAESVVANLIQYGFVRGRAVLGVTVHHGSGIVQIVTVAGGSSAERAGLLPGDIILSVNGERISTFTDFRKMLDSLSPNDTANIIIRRNNNEFSLTAVLDEYRPMGL